MTIAALVVSAILFSVALAGTAIIVAIASAPSNVETLENA